MTLYTAIAQHYAKVADQKERDPAAVQDMIDRSTQFLNDTVYRASLSGPQVQDHIQSIRWLRARGAVPTDFGANITTPEGPDAA